MPVSEQEKLRQIVAEMEEVELIAYRFEQLLNGFKKYDELKGTLDIMQYEALLDMFSKAIIAMEENNIRHRRIINRLQDMLQEE